MFCYRRTLLATLCYISLVTSTTNQTRFYKEVGSVVSMTCALNDDVSLYCWGYAGGDLLLANDAGCSALANISTRCTVANNKEPRQSSLIISHLQLADANTYRCYDCQTSSTDEHTFALYTIAFNCSTRKENDTRVVISCDITYREPNSNHSTLNVSLSCQSDTVQSEVTAQTLTRSEQSRRVVISNLVKCTDTHIACFVNIDSEKFPAWNNTAEDFAKCVPDIQDPIDAIVLAVAGGLVLVALSIICILLTFKSCRVTTSASSCSCKKITSTVSQWESADQQAQMTNVDIVPNNSQLGQVVNGVQYAVVPPRERRGREGAETSIITVLTPSQVTTTDTPPQTIIDDENDVSREIYVEVTSVTKHLSSTRQLRTNEKRDDPNTVVYADICHVQSLL